MKGGPARRAADRGWTDAWTAAQPAGPARPLAHPHFPVRNARAGPGRRGERGWRRCRAEPPYLAPRSRRSGRSRSRRPSAAPAAASCCGRGPSSPLGARRGAKLCGRLRPGRKMRNWSAAPARRGAPSPPAPRAGAAVPPLRPPPGGGSPQGAAPGLRARARGGPGRGQRGANPPVPVPVRRCCVRRGSSGRAPRQPQAPLATTR